uniref:Uncharacterized protein n=1 Tax=Porphyridium purpureum TaxID=35688 RepID=W0S275_PORPP|nr:hypothetical protein Y721_p010 [Porphyridium purpureum]BAO23798.1 hypothetical protein [Porphyridium purpureum]
MLKETVLRLLFSYKYIIKKLISIALNSTCNTK